MELEQEPYTFLEKHFSGKLITWNRLFAATIIGAYSFIIVVVSTVFGVYIKSITSFKNESINSVVIFSILTSLIYGLSKYATFTVNKKDRKNRNTEKLNSEINDMKSQIQKCNSEIKTLKLRK